MGVVFKARQAVLNREVALKRIGAGPDADPGERKRFRVEGEAMARLHHPNVVQVFDFPYDDDEGQYYLCMEYLEGGTLADRLDGLGLPLREAAQLVLTLAEAVHAAHEQNIVHRDLKPSNVLFAADGTPKISDFGLAKLQDSETTHTSPDVVLGTPSYMAPEQAAPTGMGIGPAADLYSLGAILYEVLTGRPPFKAESRRETLKQVLSSEPVSPRKLRPAIPRDLEAVCLKCLEKDPKRRFHSAHELALELELWLDGKPTRTQPPPWYAIVWRRLPKRIIATGSAVFAAVAILLVYSWPPDPNAAIEKIETKLANGEEVKLIGAKGKPAWWHCRTANSATQTSLADDGTFTVSSWGSACLDLVRDPQVEHFTLEAEVRHEKADVFTDVGLYVGMKDYPLGDNAAYFYVRLVFDDIQDFRKVFKKMFDDLKTPEDQRPPLPAANPVYFGPLLQWEGKALDVTSGVQGQMAPQILEPSGNHGVANPWRKLEIEVKPDRVDATFDGKAIGGFSADRIKDNTRKQLDGNKPPAVLPGAMRPGFEPRSGCGLYVNKSVASFRNVIIKPKLEQGEKP